MSSANFDITLSMVLACSGTRICGLFSPVTSWYTLPAVTDMSREADIARLNITETLCTVIPSVLQLMMRLSLNTC